MKVIEQITKGLLISPKSRRNLVFSEDRTQLQTEDKSESYQMINNIPILIEDNKKHSIEFNNEAMDLEYSQANNPLSFAQKFKQYIYGDMFSEQCKDAKKIFDKYSENDLLLSIGGGPVIDHPYMTNINISTYPNVEVVADAHQLPYSDNSVDAIYIAAVIEHLYNPLEAIQEMYRVLKPGGIVLSLTPFMQPYHGYPHHYQNLTLTGHQYYFTSKNFKLLRSGTAVGPTVAVIIIISKYILNYFPPLLNKLFGGIFILFAMIFIKPLDKIIDRKSNSHIVCSETFVLVQK